MLSLLNGVFDSIKPGEHFSEMDLEEILKIEISVACNQIFYTAGRVMVVV